MELALEAVPFVDGYGVEVGGLIDVAQPLAVSDLTQVDLGRRVHRNRSLREPAKQAEAVIDAGLSRSELRPAGNGSPPDQGRDGDDAQRRPLCDLVVHHAGREVPRLAAR